MSTPRFYWYPDPVGSLEVIDLLEGVTDFNEVPAGVRVEDAYSGSYIPHRSFQGGSRLYRITLERFGDPGISDLEHKLLNMETHLQKGGVVGFSRDHAKTWAAITVAPPTRGDIIIHAGPGNGFSGWSSTATVVEGDEMVLESPPAEWQRENFRCAANNVGSPPTKIGHPGVVYTYNDYSLVRWRDFLPVLRLPRDQVNKPYVPHDHRRNWTLDITLEYNPASVIALWTTGVPYQESLRDKPTLGSPALRGTSSGRSPSGSSLDQLLGTAKIGARAGFKGRG